MLSTSFLLATLMTAGQVDASKTEPAREAKVTKNEHLIPFEPLIGKWEAQRKSRTGEVQSVTHTEWRWALDHQVMIEETTQTSAGTVLYRSMAFLFWDPSDSKVKMSMVGTGLFMPANAQSVLAQIDETGFLFDSHGVLRDGSTYVSKVKFSPAEDRETFTWRSKKVSGKIISDTGLITFSRCK